MLDQFIQLIMKQQTASKVFCYKLTTSNNTDQDLIVQNHPNNDKKNGQLTTFYLIYNLLFDISKWAPIMMVLRRIGY